MSKRRERFGCLKLKPIAFDPSIASSKSTLSVVAAVKWKDISPSGSKYGCEFCNTHLSPKNGNHHQNRKNVIPIHLEIPIAKVESSRPMDVNIHEVKIIKLSIMIMPHVDFISKPTFPTVDTGGYSLSYTEQPSEPQYNATTMDVEPM